MDKILLKDDPQFDKIFNLLADRMNRAVMLQAIHNQVHHIQIRDGVAELHFKPEDEESED